MIQGRAIYQTFAAFGIAPDTKMVQEEQHNNSQQTTKFTTPKNTNKFFPINTPIMHRDNAMFLMQHTKLGHAPFQNMHWAAKLGILLR
jgi:hypothetical protein